MNKSNGRGQELLLSGMKHFYSSTAEEENALKISE